MKRSALQNKRVSVLRKALRARKVFGTFEKRALVPDWILASAPDSMTDNWARLSTKITQDSQ